jgi:hypothetical protein
MQAISDAPSSSAGNTSSSLTSLGGGGKSGQVKDKFARFYELFEEVVERHRVGRLLDEEGVERERKVVEEEVVGIVVESFRRFCVKAGGKGKSESSSSLVWSPFISIFLSLAWFAGPSSDPFCFSFFVACLWNVGLLMVDRCVPLFFVDPQKCESKSLMMWMLGMLTVFR